MNRALLLIVLSTLLSTLNSMPQPTYGNNVNRNVDGVNYERNGYDGFNYNINNGYSNNGFYAPPPPPPPMPYPIVEPYNAPMQSYIGPQQPYMGPQQPYNGPPMPNNRNYRPYSYDDLDNYNIDLYARYSNGNMLGYNGPYQSQYRTPMNNNYKPNYSNYGPAPSYNNNYQQQQPQYGSYGDNNHNKNYNQNRYVATAPMPYTPAPVYQQPPAPAYQAPAPAYDDSQLYNADYYSTLNDLANYDPVLARAIDIYIKNKNKNWNNNAEKMTSDSSAYNANANGNYNADVKSFDGSLNYAQQQPSYNNAPAPYY